MWPTKPNGLFFGVPNCAKVQCKVAVGLLFGVVKELWFFTGGLRTFSSLHTHGQQLSCTTISSAIELLDSGIKTVSEQKVFPTLAMSYQRLQVKTCIFQIGNELLLGK
jgi:hypothetical protein